MIDHAVMAYKGTKTDILYGVAMDHAVMAYKDTETDILCGVEGCNPVNSIYLPGTRYITFSYLAVKK
jgi:hypothetical protein